MKDYSDILHYNYNGSKTRQKMTVYNRAAQFSPFSALTGFEQAIDETARQVKQKIQLSTDEIERLNEKINLILKSGKNQISSVVYFVGDKLKQGGEYKVKTGFISRIDTVNKLLIFTDKTTVCLEDILQISNSVAEDY